MGGTLDIYRDNILIAKSDGTILPEITDSNTIDVPNNGGVLYFNIYADGIDDNCSFTVSSDSDWCTIKRERNNVTLIVSPNYGAEQRLCNVYVKHNVSADVECLLCIVQDETEYEILLDRNEVNLPLIGHSEVTLNVTCVGGTQSFNVFKPKKYRHIILDGQYEYDKLVSYDYGIKVNRNVAENTITIISDGTLDAVYDADGEYLNDSFYIVTVSHSDIIGVTDTVKVSFTGNMPNAELIVKNDGSIYECEPVETLSHDLNDGQQTTITPSISLVDERDDYTEVNSTEYREILVETVPAESTVFLKLYSDFIDDVKISHNGQYSTISIKAKPNPYSFERHCMAYIVNGEYPYVQQKIYMVQHGNT